MIDHNQRACYYLGHKKASLQYIENNLDELYEVKKGRVYVKDPVEHGKVVRIKKEVLQSRLTWAHEFSTMRMAKIYINALITFVVTNKDNNKKGRDYLLQKMISEEVFLLANLTNEEFEKLQEESNSSNFWNWQVAYLEMAMQMIVEEAQRFKIENMNNKEE